MSPRVNCHEVQKMDSQSLKNVFFPTTLMSPRVKVGKVEKWNSSGSKTWFCWCQYTRCALCSLAFPCYCFKSFCFYLLSHYHGARCIVRRSRDMALNVTRLHFKAIYTVRAVYTCVPVLLPQCEFSLSSKNGFAINKKRIFPYDTYEPLCEFS